MSVPIAAELHNALMSLTQAYGRAMTMMEDQHKIETVILQQKIDMLSREVMRLSAMLPVKPASEVSHGGVERDGAP